MLFLSVRIGIVASLLATFVTPLQAQPLATLDDVETAFIADVHARFTAKQYAELDALEEECLRTKARLPGGAWKINLLVRALGRGVVGVSEPASGDEFESRLQALRAWAAERPQSTLAPMLIADATHGFAWHVRGVGSAKTVGDYTKTVYQARLNQGVLALNVSRRTSGANPQWYALAIDYATALGWPAERVRELLAQAIKIEPLYQPAYMATARYLLPRWYGDAGDWEQLANDAAASAPGPEGQALYGFIARYVAWIDGGSPKFFAENDVPWPRLKNAIAESEKLYGSSLETTNALAQLAYAADDRATARLLAERIGGRWHRRVWRDEKAFETFRAWATGEP